MDFRLSEEQQLLRDSIARFVANEYGFETRKAIVASEKGWSAAVWAQFADMGLLGVPFAETHGGFGGSMVDVMVVMQELGRGLVVEPYLSTVVLATT
jgi:alkylation response protein AidB-like acyl-CoA dehydrogenase